jgi:hypothetical protein
MATIVAFVVGSIAVFPYADVSRYDAVQFAEYGIPHSKERRPVDLFTETTDYGAVTDVALAIRHTDQYGHTDGRQLLGAALFWVPRALWWDKPTNTYYIIATDIGFPNTNLDSPLWAEGFIDFGWPGVVFFLGVFGAVSSRLDYRYIYARRKRRPRTPVSLPLLLMPCMAAYEPIIVRGSLLQAMNHLAMLIVLLLIITRGSAKTS